MDKPKSIIQSEVKQKEKDKYCVLKHAYEIWKDGTDESICKAAMETWQNFLQLKKNTLGMDEFNSEGHYIYYCGKESLSRNGVALIVKRSPK